MNRTAKKIWNAASTVLVALVVLLAVLLVGVRLVGLQVFAVLGGLGVLLIALGLITSAKRRKASRA